MSEPAISPYAQALADGGPVGVLPDPAQVVADSLHHGLQAGPPFPTDLGEAFGHPFLLVGPAEQLLQGRLGRLELIQRELLEATVSAVHRA